MGACLSQFSSQSSQRMVSTSHKAPLTSTDLGLATRIEGNIERMNQEILGSIDDGVLSAMQDLPTQVIASGTVELIYHEAPYDVLELIFVLFSTRKNEYGRGKGGLNVLRLVSKRCMQVAESVATVLSGPQKKRQHSFPIVVLQRCKRIREITLHWKSIEELSPLTLCLNLKRLYLNESRVYDLSPLSICINLETLVIIGCFLIASLAPLSWLHNLHTLDCRGIDSKASLLPLLSCNGLAELRCNRDAVDLDQFLGVSKLKMSQGTKEHCIKLVIHLEKLKGPSKKKIYSPPHQIATYNWRILAMGSTAKSGSGACSTGSQMLGIFLDASGVPRQLIWTSDLIPLAKITYTLVNQKEESKSISKMSEHKFSTWVVDWGFSSFLQLASIEDQAEGWLKSDGTIEIKCSFNVPDSPNYALVSL